MFQKGTRVDCNQNDEKIAYGGLKSYEDHYGTQNDENSFDPSWNRTVLARPHEYFHRLQTKL